VLNPTRRYQVLLSSYKVKKSGSNDDTFSEMEEIPKEILNAIDSFNVESDEELIGFE
jgi:hypothetical protein